MEIKELLQQGFRSILLHRLRTVLSTLGILFGIVAVITMLSIGEGAKRETLMQIEQLGLRNIIIRQNSLNDDQQKRAFQQGSYGLTISDGAILKKALPDVQNLAEVKVVKASLNAALKDLSPEILATNHDFAIIQGLDTSEGHFITSLDVSLKQQICVLGSEIARSLGKDGHIGRNISIGNTQFKVVGVLEHKAWKPGKTTALTTRNLNHTVFIPLGTERALSRNSLVKNNMLTELIIQIDQRDQVEAAVPLVKHLMANMHKGVEDYQIVVPRELMDQADRTQYTFNLVLGSVAAISLLVGGIGIMNIMLASVSERIREIGIRRAVGANRFHIARQFLLESLLITFLGTVGGVIAGILISLLIGFWAGWHTVVTPWSVGLSLLMSAGVGLCSGLYPAWKAASLNPISALRHE
jgi:putative ABC transport system permease protein